MLFEIILGSAASKVRNSYKQSYRPQTLKVLPIQHPHVYPQTMQRIFRRVFHIFLPRHIDPTNLSDHTGCNTQTNRPSFPDPKTVQSP
jgi:hypothetical protein